MQKQLLVVNKKDEIIAIDSLEKCHSGKGILHRAITVFIFNERKEILIAKRAKNKRLWPEAWKTSCSTHVYKNESYTQAGEKRLPEE